MTESASKVRKVDSDHDKSIDKEVSKIANPDFKKLLSNPDIYYVHVELEASDDWDFKEIETRFADEKRQEKAKSYVSKLTKIHKEIYLSQLGNIWSISIIGEHDSIGIFTFLQQLTMDVFDRKFTKMVTKTNIGGYMEDIIR